MGASWGFSTSAPRVGRPRSELSSTLSPRTAPPPAAGQARKKRRAVVCVILKSPMGRGLEGSAMKMMWKVMGLAGCVLAVLLSTSSAFQTAEVPEVHDLAPDFTLQDSQGETYRLSEFRGKNVVLE